MSNIQNNPVANIFFSKDNIAGLNKLVLEKNNLLNVNKDTKAQIVNLLINNMKTVYKSLDQSKINGNNAKSILKQLNEISINESIKDIKKSGGDNVPNQSASDLKFQRDFKSNPTAGNKIMDRPQPVSNKLQQNYMFPKGFENANPNNLDNRFDKLFKPIVDNPDNNFQFNQYQYGKGQEDFNNRVNMIQSEREKEVFIGNGRPKTPDFLKPISTQPDKTAQMNNNNNNFPQQQRNGKPDFSQPVQEHEDAFGTFNQNDGDLYSINNIDNSVMDVKMVEDNRSFQERLKELESNRGSINIPRPNGKIDFTNDNDFRKDDLDQIPDFEPKSIEQIQQERNNPQSARHHQNGQIETNQQQNQQQMTIQQQQYLRNQEQQIINQQNQQRQQMINQQNQQMINNPEYEQLLRLQQNEQLLKMQLQEQLLKNQQYELMLKTQQADKILNTIQQKPKQVISTNKQKSDKIEKPIKNDKNSNLLKIQESLKKLGLNGNDNSEILKLREENILLKQQLEEKQQELENIDTLKKEMENEFEKLNDKNKEILEKEDEINKKLEEITKKENKLKEMYEKYSYVFSSSEIQCDISPNESLSEYIYDLDNIENVIGIKLLSYSIPQPRYNIEQNKNNIFRIHINGEDKEYKLNNGKYKIEDLLNILSVKTGLKFSLDIEEKIVIQSEENFNIIPTVLSQEVLGFTEDCENNNIYTANNLWDLRIEDLVYVYLDNIDENIPFAILNPTTKTSGQFKFEEPINLTELKFIFKDSKNRLFNFYGLKYNLNIQLEIIDNNKLIF